MKEIKLNLGCGKDIKKEYINIDRIKLPGVDIQHDLNKLPLPFKTNYADEVILKHVLEHIHKHQLKDFLREIHRITKPTGKIYINVPYFFSSYAVLDLEHENFFVWQTLACLCSAELYNYLLEKRFVFLEQRFGMLSHIPIYKEILPKFATLFPKFYERFLAKIFTCDEIQHVIRPIK